jgi:hypothetical protein
MSMGISEEITNRLRISGPKRTGEDRDAMRKALTDGIEMLRREGEDRPSLKAVIWRLMRDAAKTEATFEDRERAWLAAHGRSAWPGLARSSEECRVVEWEQQLGLMQGTMHAIRTPMPRLDIYHADHERTLLVLDWLRLMLPRSRTFERFIRDREIVLEMARGVSLRRLRVKYFPRDSGDSAVFMVKDKMLRIVEEWLNKILTDTGSICINVAS